MKSILSELKDFIFRGNVIDMAVGVIIGAAFGAIVNSLVNDVFMPLISLVTGTLDFSGLSLNLRGMDGAATLNYGAFLTAVINFLLIAVCIFFFIKAVNKLTSTLLPKEEPAPDKPARLCPFCFGELHEEARRCPHCTSDVSASALAPAQG